MVSAQIPQLFIPGVSSVVLAGSGGVWELSRAQEVGFWELPVRTGVYTLVTDGSSQVDLDLPTLLAADAHAWCKRAVLAREVLHGHPLDVTSTFYSNDPQIAFLGRFESVVAPLPVFFIWTQGQVPHEVTSAVLTQRQPGQGVTHASGLFLQDSTPAGDWSVEVVTIFGHSLCAQRFTLLGLNRMKYGVDVRANGRRLLDLHM